MGHCARCCDDIVTTSLVQVPVASTVEDVLQETLREHKKEHASAGALTTYHSRCYELRLPDGDRVGYPDDDVPGMCVLEKASLG